MSLRPSQTSLQQQTWTHLVGSITTSLGHSHHCQAILPSLEKPKHWRTVHSPRTSCKYTERLRARQIRCTSHTWPRPVLNSHSLSEEPSIMYQECPHEGMSHPSHINRRQIEFYWQTTRPFDLWIIQALQLLTHAWKPSGLGEAKDSKERICNS